MTRLESTDEGDPPDLTDDTYQDGSQAAWAQSEHTRRFYKGAVEDLGKRRQELLQQCADSSDPRVRHLHGQYLQSMVTVNALKKLMRLT